MLEYMCVGCGTTFIRYNSANRYCGKCQYNKYYAGKKVKPIKRIGKKAAKWIEDRHDWIKANPPTHNGKWECYLKTTPLCPRYLDIDQLTIDHIEPKSGRDNANDFSNLAPACVYCNNDKGSMSLENYLKSKNTLDLT